MNHTYPAARAGEDEVDAGIGSIRQGTKDIKTIHGVVCDPHSVMRAGGVCCAELHSAHADAVAGLFSALGVSLIGEPVSAGDVYTAILLPRFGARLPARPLHPASLSFLIAPVCLVYAEV